MSKTVLVFGATGAQGGSVVSALEGSAAFKLRAVTRKPDSPKAQELAKKGVEVVQGDLAGTLPESIFQGVDAVFLVTNFWDPSTGDKEVEQGKVVVDLAKKAGVTHFIFSSLLDGEKVSNGKYKPSHVQTKAKLESYIRDQGFKFTAFPAPAFYYQNFQQFFPPTVDAEGNLTFNLGKTALLGAVDVNETGVVVKIVLEDPEKWNGVFIPLVGEFSSLDHYAQVLSKNSGKKVTINQIPFEVYKTLPFPAAEDLADMWGLFDEFMTNTDPELAKQLPPLKSFQEWADQQGKLF